MRVRQALVALTQEGLVYGRARKGTSISAPKIDQQFLALTGFTEEMQRHGQQPIEYVRSQYRGDHYKFTALVTSTR